MILLRTEPQREVPVKTSSMAEHPIRIHFEWVAGLGGTVYEQLKNWAKRHRVQLERGVVSLPQGWMTSVAFVQNENIGFSEATHVLDPEGNPHLLFGVFEDRPEVRNYLIVIDATRPN